MNNNVRINEFYPYLRIFWARKHFAQPRRQVEDALRALPKADAGKGLKVGPLTVRCLARDGWDMVGTLEWDAMPGFHVLVRVDRQGGLLGWGEPQKKRRA